MNRDCPTGWTQRLEKSGLETFRVLRCLGEEKRGEGYRPWPGRDVRCTTRRSGRVTVPFCPWKPRTPVMYPTNTLAGGSEERGEGRRGS